MLTLVTPSDLRRWLEDDQAVLIDVREPAERAAAAIPGSQSAPLSGFDPAALHADHPSRRVVFHCKAGPRAQQAAERYAHATGSQAHTLTGGLDAWRAQGLPLEGAAPHAPPDVMRQVHAAAGGLVLAGAALSALVSPWFLLAVGFVGGGLLVAGLTGRCGMAALLNRLPHNRPACAT